MKKNRGFTAFEMLVSFIVVAVLATLSMITYENFRMQNAVSAAMNQLSNAMLYARSQAVLQNAKVTLCGSHSQIHCDGGWEGGQIALSHDKLLQVFPALSARLRVVWISSFNKNLGIEFTEEGRTQGQQGRFEFYNMKNRLLAKIVVTHAGRLRLEKEE